MIWQTHHLVLTFALFVTKVDISKGYELKTNKFKNICGKNRLYDAGRPFEVFPSSTKTTCAKFCQRSAGCSSFNAIGKDRRKLCEFFHQRPTCTELSVQNGAAYYMKTPLCPNGNSCDCPEAVSGPKCTTRCRDCTDYITYGLESRTFIIKHLYIWPDRYPEPFQTRCSLIIAGGTFIQLNRGHYVCDPNNPTDYFNRNWQSYKKGFGELDCKFWLGLDKIHAITSQKRYQLDVIFYANHDTRYGYYADFKVGSEADGYRLSIGPFVGGGTGDSLLNTPNPKETLNGTRFSTFDRDNDNSATNCAADFEAGFWFNDCAAANPNGYVVTTQDDSRDTSVPSILWKYNYGDRNIKFIDLRLEVMDGN